MAYSFGDGFDLYAAAADATGSYWDASTATSLSIVAGRFGGSRAFQWSTLTGNSILVKSSSVNDAVHHFVLAFLQTNAITGSNFGVSLQLSDGATAQCSVVFRSDGAVLLYSGTPAGTLLDTYTGAVTLNNTWYAFEFEIVINNTTGSWAVRKNGNTSNDHALGSLNTRGGTANNYANKLQLSNVATTVTHQLDDFFWRSDAASVPWMGDIRCFTRMPANDQSVQFSRTPSSAASTPATFSANASFSTTTSYYAPITAAYDGTVATATMLCGAGFTGNLKCSVFNSSGSAPTTVVASANTVVNPSTGTVTFTFGTPFSVAKGVQYWIGFAADGSYTNAVSRQAGSTGVTSSTVSYASFPTASPTTSTTAAVICTWTITVGTNNSVVNEAQQNTTTDYVYDSTVNDADFYGIAAIASTPVATIAVTTRGYMQKSDAGTRTAAVQLKSGSATVASSTLVLTTSGWQWAWRTDTVDPNTSAAWTAAAVNNAQVGPKVIA